jgi:hypothetical protein
MIPQVIVDRILGIVAWTPVGLLVLVVPVTFWWLFEPVPVELRYVAPSFSSVPAATRDEADKTAVMAVTGGTTVYRYVEYCVRRPFVGTARRSWVNSALVWHAPDVPTTLSRQTGCRSASVAVETPTSSPSRSFLFSQSIEIDTNLLRTDRIEYPPIPLTILATK